MGSTRSSTRSSRLREVKIPIAPAAGVANDGTRPVIGVTCCVREASYANWTMNSAILPSTYTTAITRAGGTPVIIPPSENPSPLLDSIDGLVIAGGPDLDPATLGQNPDPNTVEFYPKQDASEINLLEGALERDKPMLCVCRGMQLLAVLHGGRLHQHLDSTPGHEGHGGYGGVVTEHGVIAKEGSRIATLMGMQITANSTHHQGVADAGSLTVTALAEHDGLIEAVERNDLRFCLGVQWHPERIGHDVLYSALVQAARG